MFKKFCIPLMLINNNVYTFISGILLSLSTGVFTTLCLEKWGVSENWFLYVSVILYLVCGAICIYISSKITPYQNYISANKIILFEEQKSVLCDFEWKKRKKWISVFLGLIFSFLSGTGLLVCNICL